MKRLILLLIFFLLFVPATACSPPREGPAPETSPVDAGTSLPDGETDVPAVGSEQAMPDPEPSDLTVYFPKGPVTLLAYEDEMNLVEVLGMPVLEETIVLENADTFTGSHRKTLGYEHTTMTLFSPRDDGERFYVYRLESTDDALKTFRGVGVGDSLEKVRQAYPELTRSLDGTTGDDGRHEFRIPGSAYTDLFFFVEEGKVAQIQLLHEFP